MRLIGFISLLLCSAAFAQPNATSSSDWLKQLAKGATGNTEEFLPVDEAFRVFELQRDDGSIDLEWVIQPGYYLYQHSLKALPANDRSTDLIEPKKLSPGQWYDDPEFGRVQVYSELAKTQIWPAADVKQVEIHYQGCAKAGLCYPPQKKLIRLTPSTNRAEQSPRVTGTAPPPWAQQLANDRLNVVWVDADWCGPCKSMEKNVFSAAGIQVLVAQSQWIEWDVTDIDANEALLDELQLPGPPALLFYDRNGKLLRPGTLLGQQSIASVERALRQAISLEREQHTN